MRYEEGIGKSRETGIISRIIKRWMYREKCRRNRLWTRSRGKWRARCEWSVWCYFFNVL